MNPPTPPQISASQFPQVYTDLGIDPGKLGCIMLDVEPIQVSNLILYDDLYHADPDEHPWMQGIVSESVPHVTLLYGLLRSGIELKKHVDAVLDGWTPQDVSIATIDVFPSNDPDESYVTLIAKLAVTPNLLEANARLKLLPHIDTFPTYQGHITLAYLNDSSDYQGYISTLNNALRGKTVKAVGLNYGD
jgi:2'-5' RNA ligase superfamily